MEQDEQELIASAKNGDAEAFGIIVERYMPKALSFARHMTGNAEDAQDLAQEAFIRAYNNIATFKGESGFYSWFIRVLYNLCIDHLRRAAFVKKVFFFARPGEQDEEDPMIKAPDMHPGSIPDMGLEQKELRAALTAAISRLPKQQRAVFLMKHHEGMKLSEIAVALHISEGAVKSHLVRAVTALKKSMKGYGGH
jgi:RNA polymerase sigma-70 factor (ECF subfamily)